MTQSQQEQIKEAHFKLPEGCRCQQASAESLMAFEDEFGTIPPDYKWYLAECGGGVIGSEWIDGIEQLTATHRKIREGQKKGFYTVPHFFALGWDGCGNPYGYDLDSGPIVTEDHNFGGVHKLAADFYGLLFRTGLIK